MHRHLHRTQQPLRITGRDGRPRQAHHLGHAEAVQGYLHGLLGAAGEQEAIGAIEINTLQWDGSSLKREVLIYPIAEWGDVILDSELKALVNNFMIKAEEYGI
jgi:hypothetical protein